MFGLSFLAPLFLAGAVAAAIPILLHLFHRRAEPVVEFAAMRYLQQAPVEQTRRRRVRELVLLALRVTALLLIALAFARPYLVDSAAVMAGGATVVLVDTSASVTAPGQFERVRARATEIVRDTPPTQGVAVLTFAHNTDVLAPLATDRSVALAALSRLTAGAGATRYRAALRRGGEELAGRPGRIVVITDLQESGWDPGTDGVIPDNASVEIETVSPPPGNLAVTSLRVETGEVVATVANFSSSPATSQVVFAAGERRLGAVALALPASGTSDARLPAADLSGVVTATVSDDAGYAADNVRYALVDEASGISVLVVTASGNPAEALYFARALGISSGAGGFGVRSVAGAAVGALDDATFRDVDVVAVLGTRGLDQRGRQRLAKFVESGGGVLIAAGPEVEPGLLTQAPARVVTTAWQSRSAADMSFAPADSRHPVFRLFGSGATLGTVRFTQSALLEAPQTGAVLARYSDGTPALVEERTAGGRVLLFASDLNYRWNDFPLQPAFVPFVHETMRYLAAGRETRTDYVVGELAGQATHPGVMTIGQRSVTVNVDPRESNPAAMTADTFTAGASRMQAAAVDQARAADQQREDGQGLWRYGLLLMLVTLAAEGLLGRRLS